MEWKHAWLGSFVKRHEIGPYVIDEYYPYFWEGCEKTKRLETTTRFLFAISGREDNTDNTSYESLQKALAACIAFEAEGHNHHADEYFIKSLGI